MAACHIASSLAPVASWVKARRPRRGCTSIGHKRGSLFERDTATLRFFSFLALRSLSLSLSLWLYLLLTSHWVSFFVNACRMEQIAKRFIKSFGECASRVSWRKEEWEKSCGSTGAWTKMRKSKAKGETSYCETRTRLNLEEVDWTLVSGLLIFFSTLTFAIFIGWWKQPQCLYYTVVTIAENRERTLVMNGPQAK